MDVSEDLSSTVGLSQLGDVNDKVVASSVLGQSLSGGSSSSLPHVAYDVEAPAIDANLSMHTSEDPFSIAGSSRLGGVNDKIAVSSVSGVIEPLCPGPFSSPLAACLAQAPSIATDLPVDKDPQCIAGPPRLKGVNDKIAVSSVRGVIQSLSAGPSSSLPLAARLSQAPSIAANSPIVSERLSVLFPVPTSTDIPLNSVISPLSQSRFLLIWNLPAHFVWNDVVRWIGMCISYLGKFKPVLERVVRTNQRGEQAFWLAFNSIGGASAFRGVVAGRQAADTQIIKCDFVDGNEYSSASSRSSDFWTPKDGFVAGVSPTTPFPVPSAAEMAAPSLTDRLAPFHRRTHRSKKKKVKVPRQTGGLGNAP